MELHYSKNKGLFWVQCAFEERELPARSGFTWNEDGRRWVTGSDYMALALVLLTSPDILGPEARKLVYPLYEAYRASWATGMDGAVPAPDGCEYIPYQRAGIIIAGSQFATKAEAILFGDPMGLGKTIQAIGTCNLMGWTRPLVVCPAHLRINWRRELDKWLLNARPARAVLTGKTKFARAGPGPMVISYDLASKDEITEILSWHSWDTVIFDEGHYLKNTDTNRTRACLGSRKYNKDYPGLAQEIGRSMVLSGTPAPNRVHELHTVIARLRPSVIDGQGYWSFVNRYCEGYYGDRGFEITGAKRTTELSARLRGSGFMIRRSKKEVLPDLPPKRYSMVVFPADSKTARVIKREEPFDADEIIREGVPVGSPLPEIRREMGEAKVPVCIKWIKDQLEELDKLLVGAYHRDVIASLTEALEPYGAVMVRGGMSDAAKQEAVDAFQNDPKTRVFIGQLQAAGTGYTLTAACDVAIAEPSYVPGENEQFIDRTHRIGQTAQSVNIHYLVVEGSLDAKILSKAAEKESDLKKVLD